ncbi:MAG: 16S rRNA (uracil(1498)-N(3))-methyltransferase [Candidatus Marinimicrobia bacterium]|nr:16S rRNA (uracil(1498)-N(3))-methyltransferase [Candidatus Neomarinimicrobiota bacterium]MCF7839547.1 16S rRNA (uracil(1498)-N(3))-methyltransferase [Candidatus Neomarinimicrobiota bacterium]MCF7901908.1 16S rRNA (uracil(1498)-N(3))-methyltransferase [Candidatus Neomarinimicrobiota bacterium]
MSLEQVFLPDLDLDAPSLRITGSELHHLRTVRRFGPGQQVVAVSGKGHARTLTLEKIEKDTAYAQAGVLRTDAGELALPLTLCVANLKSDHLEWVVEKATELGAWRIVPLLTDHTVKKGLRLERLERIAISALKQSGRSRLPVIDALTPFDSALRNLNTGEHWFCIAAPSARPVVTLTTKPATQPLTVWIGPEGDWSEEEWSLAMARGLTPVDLGSRRLRAETAAISAMSTVSQWIEFSDNRI